VRLDRVAEDIYILISEQYAQVTSTVLITSGGAILIDTLPFPGETREIVAFLDSRLGPNRVRYIVFTHHHSDHIYGAYLFEEAEIVAHDLCRSYLSRLGERGLERAKHDVPALAEVELRLPDITFQKELHLHLGHRHLELYHMPGHTPDGIGAMVLDDKVFIAGDAVMPVPYIVNGDHAELRKTLEVIKELRPNFIIQGHGDVLLRGEIDEALDSSIAYLDAIVKRVSRVVERREPMQKLREIDIESCGKSRIPLDGLVSKLHMDNLLALYRALSRKANEQAN
jgi:cyclase